MSTLAIKDDVRTFFDENGYYVARGVFDPAEVVELEGDFDRIVQQLLASKEPIDATWTGPEMQRIADAGMQVIHTHNVQAFSAVWLKALLQQRFLDVTEAILGSDIVLHHTKLFQKPGEKGSPFPMHQDWTYFPSVKDTMIAGIIHVSEATDEMGCLRVYPGSHRLGRVQGTSGQNESEMLARYPIEGATPLEAEPGDVAFFHYFTIHGSLPNRSSSVRKTVLAQMHAGDDRIEDGNLHPNARLVLRGWNSAANRSGAGMA